MHTFFISISCIVLFFLVFPFLKVLIGLFSRLIIQPKGRPIAYDFACIITAYKNVGISLPLVHSLLKQKYRNFHIYLVADECDPAEFNFSDSRLTTFFPSPPLRLKAKSIIYAVDRFERPHNYTVIFDADNLAHPDFLQEMNSYANSECKAIQGQRTAKNLDTIYTCADATGEFYKNYVERFIPHRIGSSAVISGSGMAVASNIYQDYLNSKEIQQGKKLWKKMLQEDKVLQNFLLRNNETIAYAPKAIVYDEKATTGEQVETQRSRWLYSYFQNIPNAAGLIWCGIKNCSFNQLLFGLVTISPPLFILLFSAVLLSLIGLLINPFISLLLIAGVGVFLLNIFLSLYLSNVPNNIWRALWAIPFFIIKQTTALFKMGNPNKNFKHSEHSRSVHIEEILGEV